MKRKLNPNKIYTFIGRAVVYSSLYITAVIFFIWACTRTVIYQKGEKVNVCKDNNQAREKDN